MNFEEFKKMVDNTYGIMTKEEIRKHFSKYGYEFSDEYEFNCIIPKEGTLNVISVSVLKSTNSENSNYNIDNSSSNGMAA